MSSDSPRPLSLHVRPCCRRLRCDHAGRYRNSRRSRRRSSSSRLRSFRRGRVAASAGSMTRGSNAAAPSPVRWSGWTSARRNRSALHGCSMRCSRRSDPAPNECPRRRASKSPRLHAHPRAQTLPFPEPKGTTADADLFAAIDEQRQRSSTRRRMTSAYVQPRDVLPRSRHRAASGSTKAGTWGKRSGRRRWTPPLTGAESKQERVDHHPHGDIAEWLRVATASSRSIKPAEGNGDPQLLLLDRAWATVPAAHRSDRREWPGASLAP